MSTSVASSASVSTRVLAIALLAFLVVIIPAIGSVPGIICATAGAVGCTVAIGRMRGRTFFTKHAPFPELLVPLAWVLYAVGIRVLFPSILPQISILFLFFAVVPAAVAWLWSGVRFAFAATLQSLLTVLAAETSVVVFVATYMQL